MPSLPGLGWDCEKIALDTLGYTAPLPLAEPERAKAVCDQNIGLTSYMKNPHKTSHAVRRLLSDTGLLAYIGHLCGPDFSLWRSAFFAKSTGSAEVGWHHDKHFHCDGDDDIRLDDIGTHYSVLFGITPVDQKTGMMEFLPGTHRANAAIHRDTRPRYLNLKASHMISDLPEEVLANRRPVPIPAGSFVVFHSAILHRSQPHMGGHDRLGLAIRLVRDGVPIPKEMALAEDIQAFPPEPL